MKHLRTAIAGILTLFIASVAIAQTFPTVPSQSVIGRLGVAGTSGPSQAIPMATLAPLLGVSSDIIYVTQAPYSAACNGSADDTAAIQAAINATPATGWTIAIPRGKTCTFATPLNFKSHSNLTFAGVGGMSASANTPSILKYTGAGAAAAMDFRDSNFNAVVGMTIVAANASFTGYLIDAGATIPGVTISSGFRLQDTTIGPNFIGSVKCLNISEAIEVIVERNNFSRCGPAIHGQTILGQNTITTIRNNQFVNHVGPAIQDCGETWTIASNTFEQDKDGKANAFSNNVALPCNGITFAANWFGDETVAGNAWVQLTANGASITGNRISGATQAFGLTGGTGYSFTGNNIDSFSVGIACASSPTGVFVQSNTFTAVTTKISAGCVGVTSEGNSPSISQATTGQLLVGQSAADAAWKTITGDVTVTAAGVTAIGTAKVTMAMLATMATNTVNGNATSGSASPTALAMPSCSTAASALKWTTNTGFGCNTAIDAANATNATNSAITNDTTTNATMFPVWVTANSGNLPLKVSSTLLAWNPSTSRLGIGTASPLATLHVGGGADTSALSPTFYVNVAGAASFAVRDSTNDIEMGMFTNTASGGLAAMGTRTSHPFWIQTNSANTAAFHVSGGFSVGSTTDPGSNSLGVAGLANITTSVTAGTFVSVGTKIRAAGSAPALTSCGGGSPTISGSDLAGEVTMGTTATGCIITFNVAYASAPYCVVTWQATPLASQSYTVSTTAITTVQTSTSSNKLNYNCVARSAG